MDQKEKSFSLPAILFFVTLMAFNGYMVFSVNSVQLDAETQRASLEQEISALRETISLRQGNYKREIVGIREEMDKVSRDASVRAGSEAKRYSDRTSKTIAEKQREQQEMLLGELTSVEKKVSEQSLETQSKVDGVQGDVDGVKGELAVARESIDIATGLLQDTQGSVEQLSAALGDHDQAIEILRRNSERDLMGFSLLKSQSRIRVGDVQLKLRSADTKRNRYSIEILADDNSMIKKDRHVNEPVSFYVTGARKPYEIVITAVRKDRVIGYLAKPKVDPRSAARS